MPKEKVKQPAAATSSATSTSMEVKELVITFNKFPRAHKAYNGRHINHWFFNVRHVPTGDVLHIVNPESHATHTEGPANILTLAVDAQAEVILRLLLKAFVNTICVSFSPAIAPWSWGTKDEDLAKALGTSMTAANVRVGLCRISFGNDNHIKIEKELWVEECDKLKLITKTTCRNCNKVTEKQKLQRCDICKQVQYCSKKCQTADFQEHKKYCQLLRISTEGLPHKSGTQAAYDGFTYHTRISSKNPYVQALAKEIGLKLPARSTGMIIRRLVVTGNDTPENMLTFFGTHPTDQESLENNHREDRWEVLLDPPKGSYYYAFAKSHNFDENCPDWTPREASEDELEDIDIVKGMQKEIKRYMAAANRKLSSIDNEDMEGFLITHFGMHGWEDHKMYYIPALNSLDMGYPGGYNPCAYRDHSRTLRHWGISCGDTD